MSLEKRVLTECILLYKQFPCLWDNREVLYNNKEARDQAYEVMLEKLRQFQDDATIIDLKKRIENMRTSYRREHKKVLLSRLKGDTPEYTPQLWYYELMTFLNDVMDFTRLEPITRDIGEDMSFKVEYEEPQIRRWKRKASPGASVYLRDHLEDSDDDDNDHVGSDMMQLTHETELNTTDHTTTHNSGNINISESEAFGTTVGLQLKELDAMQKVFAEKLISDIIFNARLHRLTINSNLVV